MVRASERARRQFGAIARWQLLAMGIGRGHVESWLRTGHLHPRYPGVYAWGRPELAEEGQLATALLYAGRGSALGGLTALWWRGLLGRRPTRIHIDAPGRKASFADLTIRHPQRPLTRQLHRGLPIVPIPDALITAAPSLSANALRLLLARTEFQRATTLPRIEAALTRGRPGSAKLRAALTRHLPELAHCANALEREFLLLCESAGLPLPEPNPRIGRYRPDMLWREAGLIVELDGRQAHSTAAQLAADQARQAHLESLGYRFLRFGPEEVRGRRAAATAAVRAELGP